MNRSPRGSVTRIANALGRVMSHVIRQRARLQTAVAPPLVWLMIFAAGGTLSSLGSLINPAAAKPPIPLELNKLEPLTTTPPSCRVYFVVSNPDSTPITAFRLDLVLFGTDGVIARRIALDLGPLPAKKEMVRLFDLDALPCDRIGQILINDVLACQTGDVPPASAQQQRQACLDRLAVSSHAKASLTK
jgi:hypothetical protein